MLPLLVTMATGVLTDHYDMTNDVLGKGYFAVVKVGVKKGTSQRVAVKIIDKDLVEKEETLRAEISILRSVDHPNVVKMESVFETPENLFIVMELMEGGDLYEEITRRTTFTEADASFIIGQLLSALSYLHDNSIVHRDLKLENLLLARRGELITKVADFGLSKLFSFSKGGLSTACGTPFYVAPDVLLAMDEGGYGPLVDMWATGVILYILLSGRLPFSGDNDDELFQAILEGDLIWKSPQFDTVSDEAKDLISHLIVVETEHRHSAKQCLSHPFIVNPPGRLVHSSLAEGLKAVSSLTQQRLAKGQTKKDNQ